MSQPLYDSIWKALPDEVILALARVAEPRIGTTLRPWKTDIKLLFNREQDRVYVIDIDGQPTLLHLEYQNYLDKGMALRMFHYAVADKLQYYQQYHEDIAVLSIVVWAITGNTPSPIYESAATPGKGIISTYHEIKLGDLDWQGVDPLLLVLGPFLHGVAPENLEEVAVRMYEAAPASHRVLLLGALLNLSKRAYRDIEEIEQAILQKVRKTMDEIVEAIAEGPIGIALIERGKAEGKAEGIAEGIAEGVAKGKAEGKAEGLISAISLMWDQHFGPLPAEVEAALAKASLEQLQLIVMRLAGPPTEAGVRALLGL